MAVTQFNLSRLWMFLSFFLAVLLLRQRKPTKPNADERKTVPFTIEKTIGPLNQDEGIKGILTSQVDSETFNVHNLPITPGKQKAAFVVLVRNDDVYQLKQTMRMVEETFNRRFQYDWIFLNDKPFTPYFVKDISKMTSAKSKFGTIPTEQWSIPEWIDGDKARASMKKMEQAGIIYGGSESYRHMCRYESGFFFRHELLKDYDWYWRVEPETEYYCHLLDDVFEIMAKQEKVYAFLISFGEYMETIPTLWQTVLEFKDEWNKNHPDDQLPRDERMWKFVADDEGNYNGCHWWSNFEIGNLNWFRSPEYLEYFDWLDKKHAGFFMERWGDAPVHTLATALFLQRDQLYFPNQIGYKHNPYSHIPANLPKYHWSGLCTANPADSIDQTSCIRRWFEVGDEGIEEGERLWDPGFVEKDGELFAKEIS
jgi:alpha 1,2-mannosyltransferase